MVSSGNFGWSGFLKLSLWDSDADHDLCSNFCVPHAWLCTQRLSPYPSPFFADTWGWVQKDPGQLIFEELPRKTRWLILPLIVVITHNQSQRKNWRPVPLTHLPDLVILWNLWNLTGAVQHRKEQQCYLNMVIHVLTVPIYFCRKIEYPNLTTPINTAMPYLEPHVSDKRIPSQTWLTVSFRSSPANSRESPQLWWWCSHVFWFHPVYPCISHIFNMIKPGLKPVMGFDVWWRDTPIVWSFILRYIMWFMRNWCGPLSHPFSTSRIRRKLDSRRCVSAPLNLQDISLF